jgi:hypothetical protein
MTRLFAAASLALLIAQPAMAGGFSFDLPNLTFPSGDVTISTANCDVSLAQQVCTPTEK